MKKFVSFLVVLLVSFTGSANAEPPTRAQFAKLKKLGQSGHVTKADLEAFLEVHRLTKENAASAVLRYRKGCAIVKVDYDIKPTSMRAGYDKTDPLIKYGDFKAKPRHKGKVTKQICWFKFDHRTSSSGEAQKKIEASNDFLVADLWELNALGQELSSLQERFSLIGLGSRWRHPNGRLQVPILNEHNSDRYLGLIRFGRGWNSSYRFVAIRK